MSLIKNSIWNIAGLAIPILIAIPSMGYLARSLGIEKIGLFTLAYAVVGYASLFDMGISRAVIRNVAIYAGNDNKINKVIGTSSCFVFFLSVFATLALFFSAKKLTVLLSVSSQTHTDAIAGFHWLSLAITPFLLSTVWFSYLEGKCDFFKLNILKSTTGILISILPVFCVMYEKSLSSAIFGLVVGRLITAIVAYWIGLGRFRLSILCFNFETFKELIGFGGWITVSNIISPIMVYFDRFVLSHIIGANGVAFYSLPSEVVTRILIIPMAITKVIFPKLSSNHINAESETKLAQRLIVTISVFVAIFVFFMAEKIFLLWVGSKYLGTAVTVLKILMIGFVFNSLAQIPFAKIQAAGHSKVTASIHFFEVIPYLICLYLLVIKFSIIGAAVAWSLRVFFDYVILEFFSKKLVRQ